MNALLQDIKKTNSLWGNELPQGDKIVRRQFAIKPHRKSKSLKVQDDFDKIIDVERAEL